MVVIFSGENQMNQIPNSWKLGHCNLKGKQSSQIEVGIGSDGI